MAFNKSSRRLRIKRGIRRKISGTDSRPRLSVFKSNTGIYAQLVDDLKGQTLAQASSKGPLHKPLPKSLVLRPTPM